MVGIGRRCVGEIEQLCELVGAGSDLRGRAVQAVTVPAGLIDWRDVSIAGCLFLGVRFESPEDERAVRAGGAIVLAPVEGLPYDPFRTRLYDPDELHAPMDGPNGSGTGQRTTDEAIYRHFESSGRHRPGIVEGLLQRIHDFSIEDALDDRIHALGHPPIAAIMGGHGTSRTASAFRGATRLGFELARRGLLVASGGGPGSMEAANLGARLSAAADPTAIDEALAVLAAAPHFEDPGHDAHAVSVARRFPAGPPTLAIPTWFYGHEPSNRFSADIAKMFANSIREDTLVTIANAGIVFTPGSAGTAQEVFQDAAQNHYRTVGPEAPMVFFGREHWTTVTGIFDVVRRQAGAKPYADLLLVSDDPEEIADFLIAHVQEGPGQLAGPL